MALSLSCVIPKPILRVHNSFSVQYGSINYQLERPNSVVALIKCESRESSEEKELQATKRSKLEIGSPIIVIEAPKMIKTAAAVPCLRVNAGLVKPGDVGRIVSRKPKDVWTVRLRIGTYLIDGKYFEPLDFAEFNEADIAPKGPS